VAFGVPTPNATHEGLSAPRAKLYDMRALLDLLVPARCAGCQRPGPALCAACAALLGPAQRVLLPADVPPVFALGRYAGPLRTALLAYKERGRHDLAAPLAAALARALIQTQPHEVWLVPAPSRWWAATRRCGDHARRLADRTAARLAAAGVPAAVAAALVLTSGARDSVGLDAGARRRNVAGRVKVRAAGLPAPGTNVVLLDDVVTTGATVAACSTTLAAAGVRVSAALVVGSAARLLQPGGLRDHFVTVCGDPSTVDAASST
jgi:predicted amidophosphoribosyltransferase